MAVIKVCDVCGKTVKDGNDLVGNPSYHQVRLNSLGDRPISFKVDFREPYGTSIVFHKNCFWEVLRIMSDNIRPDGRQ